MTTTKERAIPAPIANPENQEYFDACATGTLLVGKCNSCGEYHFYPRRLCPHCFSDQVTWAPARGTGTIYTYSTMHRGVPVPYTIAYVTDAIVTQLMREARVTGLALAVFNANKPVYVRAYGWREADILALGTTRRQRYLELIAE